MVSTSDFYAVDTQAYCCPKCGALYLGPMVCKACRTRRDPAVTVFPDFDKVPLGGPCKLLTWMRIYALPDGIDRPSSAFGIVEFPNGLRALGQLMVDNPEPGAAHQLAHQAAPRDQRGPRLGVVHHQLAERPQAVRELDDAEGAGWGGRCRRAGRRCGSRSAAGTGRPAAPSRSPGRRLSDGSRRVRHSLQTIGAGW